MSNQHGGDKVDKLKLQAWEHKKKRTPLQNEVLKRLKECQTRISTLIGQGEASTARLESWRYKSAAGLVVDRQWEQALAVLTAESAPCPPVEELHPTPHLRIIEGRGRPTKKRGKPKP